MNTPVHSLAGIEIGTAAVKVAIAQFGGGRPDRLSLGTCLSQGIVGGSIVDQAAASDCIHAALAAAERKAGAKVDSVRLAQSGVHLDCAYPEATVDIESADHRVRRADISAVCELARAVDLPPQRSVVQYLRRPFRLDGQIVPNPENMPGRTLEVGSSVVHGEEPRVAAPIHLLNGLNIAVDEDILSSIASAAIVTSAEERRAGVLVLDVGAGVTDYVLYRDGIAFLTGVLPVGGNHITNDLHRGLRVTEPQAEQLKFQYARCVVTPTAADKLDWLNVDLALAPHPVPRQAIEQITSLRLRELFEAARKRLHTMFDPASIGAGVVITGGTANLPGIANLAADVFGLPARVGSPTHPDKPGLSDPTYSTVLGLFCSGATTWPGISGSPAT